MNKIKLITIYSFIIIMKKLTTREYRLAREFDIQPGRVFKHHPNELVGQPHKIKNKKKQLLDSLFVEEQLRELYSYSLSY